MNVGTIGHVDNIDYRPHVARYAPGMKLLVMAIRSINDQMRRA